MAFRKAKGLFRRHSFFTTDNPTISGLTTRRTTTPPAITHPPIISGRISTITITTTTIITITTTISHFAGAVSRWREAAQTFTLQSNARLVRQRCVPVSSAGLD